MSCNGDCNQGRECNCKCKMTKDEALRMAIEALIYHTEQTRPIEDTDIAIQACKEALAETQDGNCCTEGCIKCDARKVLAETQEPMIIKQENGMVLKLGYDELPNGTAFYTTPPSREWVGLSDWDYVEIYGHANLVDWRVVRAIEAKLREKNT